MTGTLKDSIRSFAHQLGFQLVGFTSPDPPIHYPVYENWLDQGYHGEMLYLDGERARQARKDPRLILPECASILVLGMLYPPGDRQVDRPLGVLTGQVAAYARGQDYHDLIPQKLKLIVGYIETTLGTSIPNRWYTDTGPILERELAMHAGFGWIGKNSCLIHPRHGSYFLLAEIFLGVPLEPDPPFISDHCGSCTRCVDACPTGCILPGRIIDANRCLSYLTIELKGPIPGELRSMLGNWVFGCDICQQVCPWNIRFADHQGIEPRWLARPGLESPDLVEEIQLSREEFNRKYKGTPVMRAKRRGYLRNVAVALGNSKNPEAIPALAKALRTDPEPLVRGHAAWALGQFDPEVVQDILTKALEVETDTWASTEILAALNQ